MRQLPRLALGCTLGVAAAAMVGCEQIPAGIVSVRNETSLTLDVSADLPARQRFLVSGPVMQAYEFSVAPRASWENTGRPIRTERMNLGNSYRFHVRTREQKPRGWYVATDGRLVVSETAASGADLVFFDGNGEPVVARPEDESP